MATRTGYSPGTFSWTDLTTPDPAAATEFYAGLFGWEADDPPAGEGVSYSMMYLDDLGVTAIAAQSPQQSEAGAPPAWNSYVTVQSADDAVARAARLGATVHSPAFDVLDAGRMGVLQDPQGAFFLVWEPRRFGGASMVNAPGAMTWNELATDNLNWAQEFYGELFGWTTEPLPEGDVPYRVIKNADGRTNGGMSSMAPPGTPPNWLVYFGAESADATLAQVGERGGSTLMEPTDIGPGGRIAVAEDPQGAVFALYSGRFED